MGHGYTNCQRSFEQFNYLIRIYFYGHKIHSIYHLQQKIFLLQLVPLQGVIF